MDFAPRVFPLKINYFAWMGNTTACACVRQFPGPSRSGILSRKRRGVFPKFFSKEKIVFLYSLGYNSLGELLLVSFERQGFCNARKN